LFLFSCRAKREIIREAPGKTVIKGSKPEALQNIRSSTAKYSALAIKTRANLNIAGNENDVTLNIRIRQGEAIWVSVTAIAGLEIARLLITPDSVKLINRLESTYTRKPFSYLYDFTNRQVNFGTLESIIAGNPQKEVVTDQSELSIKGNAVELKRVVESMVYINRFNTLNKLVEASLKDDIADQSLLVNYGDFMEVQEQVFPQLVSIKSQVERKNVVIDLKYNRVAINETLAMPFTVPKSFTVKN
jgi:hypothetical protein